MKAKHDHSLFFITLILHIGPGSRQSVAAFATVRSSSLAVSATPLISPSNLASFQASHFQARGHVDPTWCRGFRRRRDRHPKTTSSPDSAGLAFASATRMSSWPWRVPQFWPSCAPGLVEFLWGSCPWSTGIGRTANTVLSFKNDNNIPSKPFAHNWSCSVYIRIKDTCSLWKT